MGDNFVMVCAIDFGTTFSGYAFSFKTSPEEIIMNKNWGDGLGFQSYKTSTCVLREGGRFKDFGFDAETTYGNSVETSGYTDELQLYRQFKMILHKRGTVNRHSTVVSVAGNVHPALDIFADSLRYLKDHLTQAVDKSTASTTRDDMIRWVITVPAIWSDESKQFMREAAVKAGIISTMDSTQLLIALEPEAASLFCRRLDLNHFLETGTRKDVGFGSGTKYLVIDAGGGTIDVTAHQIHSDGSVKELHAATGGPWGGTRVDVQFESLLCDVMGKNFINTYKDQCPQQWLNLTINFERCKKAAKPDGNSSLNIAISWSMGSKFHEITGESIEKVIAKNGPGRGVKFMSGSLVINHEAVCKLFNPVTKEITDHVEDLLSHQKLHPLKFFFLVGGFAESAFLQRALIDHFAGRVTIFVPCEAQMSVIKGAVLFGHRPTEIKSRVATRTYGCDCTEVFDPSKHDESKKFIDEAGQARCRNVLEVFVEKGDEVSVGTNKSIRFTAATAAQTSAHFNIYAIDRKPTDPQYVDATGVVKLGEGITISMPDTTGGRDRAMELIVTFGGTEILVDGKDITTGKVSKTSISFLTN